MAIATITVTQLVTLWRLAGRDADNPLTNSTHFVRLNILTRNIWLQDLELQRVNIQFNVVTSRRLNGKEKAVFS